MRTPEGNGFGSGLAWSAPHAPATSAATSAAANLRKTPDRATAGPPTARFRLAMSASKPQPGHSSTREARAQVLATAWTRNTRRPECGSGGREDDHEQPAA